MSELNLGVSEKNVKRGEVYYIHRHTSFKGGHEIDVKKGRPAIIVSCDEDNANSGTVEIVYLTSGSNIKKLRDTQFVLMQGKMFNSVCKTEQIHTVDKRCIGDYAGILTEEEMEELDSCLLISLGIKDVHRRESFDSINCNDYKIKSMTKEIEELRNVADSALKKNEELRRYKEMYFDLVNALAGNKKGE